MRPRRLPLRVLPSTHTAIHTFALPHLPAADKRIRVWWARLAAESVLFECVYQALLTHDPRLPTHGTPQTLLTQDLSSGG